MIKTSSQIQVINVGNTNFPSSLVVRPPKNLKVFRCTIQFIDADFSGDVGAGYLSNTSDQNIFNTTIFSNGAFGKVVAVGSNQGYAMAPNSLTLDRRGIGYMNDEFHVSSNGTLTNATFVFVWEGETQE